MDCVQHIDSAKVNEGDKKDVELQNQRDKFIEGQRLLILTNEQPWKPWKRSRSWVKDFLVRVRCVMGSLMGMEWYCFAALGILTAFLSFLMDLSVAKLLRAHQWLYSQLEGHCLLQFLCWTLYPVSLSALSTSFSQSICPFSAGSGVPEVRTILSGVDMPHYLSLTNLFAKYVGLICTLAAGSTVFLGKVGPFVHLSTMVGAYLNQLCTVLRGEKEERTEGAMLVVAAAVGVASCFGAPISGVLFSVEVMSSHFALKDYCPCFFAAACGALTFHLLSMWSGEQETLQALFQTSFSEDLPFYPLEILVFAILGLLCGAGSCVYLFCHRWILLFIKTNKILIKVLSTEKALYSAMVVFLLASVTFPLSAGQYMASKLTIKQLLSSLLDSRQWTSQSHNASVVLQPNLCPWSEWIPSGNPYLTLGFFLFMKLWMLVLACTLPLPAGYFMPVFIYGAAIGRLFGEGLAFVSLNGVYLDQDRNPINPGGYALAGAAAFSGAVTHTLSPALLALELTGQSTHAAPILLATLVANALARSGQRPSFYDALSISKKLPHLPSLLKVCPRLSSVPIGKVLGPGGPVLERTAGPTEVQQVLNTCSQTQIPVVDTLDSRILLGSINRSDLQTFLCHNHNKVLKKQLVDMCSIRPVSVQLSPDTTVQEAHGVLSVLCGESLFVTERGRLSGVVTWPEMKRMMADLADDL
ncbi:chloride channel K [Oncorhynchus kisutch]|uniref:Chloride channel K n=1 Tax=Oncorhynchus kisutch TaxID=8019 RepID=A0A8C7MMD9_ONCKI|nr:chloride channel protein ClC-Kb [Oncorhynchus kisutch]